MLRETTKLCPTCSEELGADAEVCDVCGTTFDVAEEGYCAQCHAVRVSRAGTCAKCGGRLIDLTVRSRLRTIPGTVPSPRTVPPLENRAPLSRPTPPPAEAPTPRRPRRRRRNTWLAWVLAVLLLLLGTAGFVLAGIADDHNARTFAEDYAALADRDAGTVAGTLDARVAATERAFNDYVAAAAAVRARHEAVTGAFNAALASPGAASTRRVERAMAAYGRALAREAAMRRAYFRELRSLRTELVP